MQAFYFLAMQSKYKRVLRKKELTALFLCALLSFGAWWNSGKSKTEQRKEQKSQTDLSSKTLTSTTLKGSETTSFDDSLPLPSAKETEESEGSTTLEQQEDVEKIQEELKEIIDRTRQLQQQVKDNRSEIQKIMERAQIHEQILKNISIPRQVNTRFTSDQIVQREKLRLIAEQARQTQQQLRVIQTASAVSKIAPNTRTETKTSNTS